MTDRVIKTGILGRQVRDCEFRGAGVRPGSG